MSLLFDRDGELANPWNRIEGDAPLPDGAVIVDLERLGSVDHAPLGVHIPNNTDPALLVGDFGRIALISVGFPGFSDGRGFSIGRQLRALGFAGRLRASGPVIVDQFAYLLECGFDEVEIPDAVAERQPLELWRAALARAEHAYQRGRQGARSSILDARRARNA
ncbi:DUF934 domain-containing protein [Limibaculum sp. M0105]|uniref:DUF934 domain-containing protein n=1 Tax=Thermohalobaculum xanthum TaxID=2753746 RepID=A0A8J7M7I5_9RHOB|nr:DUF934 domain-containing protein [Thermohalobaculum xanthum]MBK0400031.1 DUF934 domain-containing protein [Thermohalobaculum xanthum]